MDYILFGLIAYLIGSIPFGLIVGKIGYKTDIREHGSGNLGGTNTFRVLGVKAGLIVTLADILKGTLAARLPWIFDSDINLLIIGIIAVIGHMYPIFAHFRGGKAVATSGGIILAVSPLLFLIILATFFVTLYVTKYVSLSSIVTGIVTVIAAIILQEIGLIIVTSILTLFVIYRHRTNIKRILNKTEPKITWM
ncbi:glycerol-3-phosphate 1-O-acyltransferase PlsY [Pontibacillus yanchengensis]|uniref:Glycerol-3-phosphate 1-O-acyltransferase PlsY n=2 Tax=Pontibacillus yanchengensis TaxID=462910 RepID=A0ACC7VAM9_9BACI|nr:glycerol-3-phosphate 1-O-acyltransferase PlsY [Pontibacillus yanchengensis]MYL33286.1 glycerol-3-phosphate 1-O-acyltransferase PlsY [Pontibacillus yanchengensis]MYL51878.1 glycerol-3-phosphate 1-O-acyltransferase PlsY [Pontibacillus yanchengensis]